MKLEHLLKAYKQNGLNVKLKNMSDETECAGVITFDNGISAAYLLDKEEIVISMKLFCNCLTRNGLTMSNQLSHTIKILNIIKISISLLCNISEKECNMILESLGMFDGTLSAGKQIRHLEHSYKLEVIDGLLSLSIAEIPPIKSQGKTS